MGGSGVVIVVGIVLLDRVLGPTADRKTAGNIWGGGGAWGTHGTRGATKGRPNRHSRGESTVGSIETGLDEIFSLGLGDKRLEFGGGESVDKASLGNDKQKDLSTSKSR